MPTPFRVGITRDVLDTHGEPAFGRQALKILDEAPNLGWEYLAQSVAEVDADLCATYDAIYVNSRVFRPPLFPALIAGCALWHGTASATTPSTSAP